MWFVPHQTIMRRNSGFRRDRREVIDDSNCLSIPRIAFSIKTSLRILPISQTCLRIIIHSPCSPAVSCFSQSNVSRKARGNDRERMSDTGRWTTAASKKKVNKTKRRRGTALMFNSSYFRFMCVSLSAPCFTADRSFVSFHYEFKVWRVKTRFPRLGRSQQFIFRSNTEERRCSVFFATASGLAVNWQKSIGLADQKGIKSEPLLFSLLFLWQISCNNSSYGCIEQTRSVR